MQPHTGVYLQAPTTTAIYKLHSNTLACMSPLLLVFLHQTTAGTYYLGAPDLFHEALYMEGTGSDLYDLRIIASSFPVIKTDLYS